MVPNAPLYANYFEQVKVYEGMMVMPYLGHPANGRLFDAENVGFLALKGVTFPFACICCQCGESFIVKSKDLIYFLPISYSLWWDFESPIRAEHANVTTNTPYTVCQNLDCKKPLVLVNDVQTVVSFDARNEKHWGFVESELRERVESVHGRPNKWGSVLRDKLNWRVNSVEYMNKFNG